MFESKNFVKKIDRIVRIIQVIGIYLILVHCVYNLLMPEIPPDFLLYLICTPFVLYVAIGLTKILIREIKIEREKKKLIQKLERIKGNVSRQSLV